MTINDAIFGELTPDPTNGEIIVQYKSIEYQIESRESISNARKIAAELTRYLSEAKDYAVQKLLTRKNENWTDQNDDGVKTPITSEQFMERMTLESISVSEDFTTFWFDGDQLFFGHVIGVDHDGKNWIGTQIQG